MVMDVDVGSSIDGPVWPCNDIAWLGWFDWQSIVPHAGTLSFG